MRRASVDLTAPWRKVAVAPRASPGPPTSSWTGRVPRRQAPRRRRPGRSRAGRRRRSRGRRRRGGRCRRKRRARRREWRTARLDPEPRSSRDRQPEEHRHPPGTAPLVRGAPRRSSPRRRPRGRAARAGGRARLPGGDERCGCSSRTDAHDRLFVGCGFLEPEALGLPQRRPHPPPPLPEGRGGAEISLRAPLFLQGEGGWGVRSARCIEWGRWPFSSNESPGVQRQYESYTLSSPSRAWPRTPSSAPCC
jgi:hypothetical protein